MDTLNKKIKSYRKSKGMTQVEMAKVLGISQPAYQKIETGNTDSMRVSTLRKFCQEFNQSADELLGLKKPKLITEFDPSFVAIMKDDSKPIKGVKIIGKKKEENAIIQPLTATAED